MTSLRILVDRNLPPGITVPVSRNQRKKWGSPSAEAESIQARETSMYLSITMINAGDK